MEGEESRGQWRGCKCLEGLFSSLAANRGRSRSLGGLDQRAHLPVAVVVGLAGLVFMDLLLPEFRQLLMQGRHDDAAIFMDMLGHFEADLDWVTENVLQHLDHVSKGVVVVVEQDDVPRRFLPREKLRLLQLPFRRHDGGAVRRFHASE